MRIALMIVLATLALPATPAVAGELEDLRDQYVLLRGTVQRSGLLAADRAACDAFHAEVTAYLAGHPDDQVAMAIDLQMMLWFDGETAQIDERYTALENARADDIEIRLAALSWRTDAGLLDETERFSQFEALLSQFPGNGSLLGKWADQLVLEGRYADVIARCLDDIDSETSNDQLVLNLAYSLFAENRFDETTELLTGLLARPFPVGDGQAIGRRSKSQQLKGQLVRTELAWIKESELRAAEAEADDLPRAIIETSKGLITVELFENDAPNTVANFISLADSGFYAGTTFHRFQPNFMIQGGDAYSKPGVEGRPGTGNPGYQIADEHSAEKHRAHFGDSLAMAKSPGPDTAGSQFYLNHCPSPWLNGKHTVFGRMIDGHDIARSLRIDDVILGITVIRRRDHDYTPVTIPIESEDVPVPPSDDAAEGGSETDG